MDLKLRQLRAALAVFRAGSALAAAGEVALSAPAVLGAVSALEQSLGERLFQRTARGMAPTQAGRCFCGRIEVGIGHLRAAAAEIGARAGFVQQISSVHLRILLALLDADGFSTAARRLGFSQASVQRAARELELLAGCALWRRKGRAIEPTAAARCLGHHAGLFHAELRMAVDELGELRGRLGGRLCAGALPVARSHWLPHALAATLRQFPQAQVSIIDGPYAEQLDALLRGEIDVILGALRFPAPAAGIEQEFLFDDPLSIVVRGGHPLAAGFDSDHDRLTAAQLAALSWVLPPRATPARANFEAFLHSKNVAVPDAVVECNSLVAIRALLLETNHAAILSARQVELELSLGQLKILGPPLSGSAQPIGLTFRAGFRPTRLGEGFLRALREGI